MNDTAAREKLNADGELQTDEILEAIRQLPSGSNITLTGGEVFLKKGIDEILSKTAAEHNVTIATNGALLGKHADVVVESGIQAIGISLDGPPEIHERIRNQPGLFDKLQDSLDKVQYAKSKKGSRIPYINFNSVILNANYYALPEVINLVKDLGGNACTFQIFDPSLERCGLSLADAIKYDVSPTNGMERIDPVALKQALQQILQEARDQRLTIAFLPAMNIDEIVLFYQGQFDTDKWRCDLPWQTMRISPYGDVYPCLNYPIGNIRSEGLANLWNNDRYVKFRRLLKQKQLFDGCTGCCKMFPNKRS
jgi:MoaA/NifB/PqqE/SkfB family radical SAM enzyme